MYIHICIYCMPIYSYNNNNQGRRGHETERMAKGTWKELNGKIEMENM